MNRFYNENEGREQAICKAPPHPQLRVDLANIVRSINKILIMPNRRASFLAGNGAGRHTPDPALAARAWVLHPPQCGPSRGLRGTALGPAGKLCSQAAGYRGEGARSPPGSRGAA